MMVLHQQHCAEMILNAIMAISTGSLGKAVNLGALFTVIHRSLYADSTNSVQSILVLSEVSFVGGVSCLWGLS